MFLPNKECSCLYRTKSVHVSTEQGVFMFLPNKECSCFYRTRSVHVSTEQGVFMFLPNKECSCFYRTRSVHVSTEQGVFMFLPNKECSCPCDIFENLTVSTFSLMNVVCSSRYQQLANALHVLIFHRLFIASLLLILDLIENKSVVDHTVGCTDCDHSLYCLLIRGIYP